MHHTASRRKSPSASLAEVAHGRAIYRRHTARQALRAVGGTLASWNRAGRAALAE